ncbi:MAG: hypothetical protein FKY71_12525, partial [Spiribacter salinus]
ARESYLIVNGNGTLNLNGYDQAVTYLEDARSSFRDGAPNNGGGAIDTGAGGILTVLDGKHTFSGVISGSGGLTKDGTGRMTLTGANTYTGPTQVLAGYLRFGADNNDTVVDSLSDQTAVYVAQGAELEVYPESQSVGSIAGEGEIDLYGHTLTVGANNTDTTFSGEISSGGSLIKTGSGVLELSGANTYSGTTTVQSGELKLTGSLGASAVTVEDGGTFSGAGTTSDALAVDSGGTLALDGPLDINGALTIASGATWDLTLADNGNNRDDVEITGVTDMTVAGSLVVGIGDGDLADRNWGSWRLVQYSGTASGGGLTIDDTATDYPAMDTGDTLRLSNVETDSNNKTLQLRLQTEGESNLKLDGSNFVRLEIDEPESNISREITFNTTQGGALFAVQEGSSHDRNLWVTADGNIGSRVWKEELLVSTGLNLTDGNTHTVTFTLGDNGHKVYVDGSEVLSGTKTTSSYDTDNYQLIGKSNDGANFSADNFVGEIEKYESWHQELTAGQVGDANSRPSAEYSLTFPGYTVTNSGTETLATNGVTFGGDAPYDLQLNPDDDTGFSDRDDITSKVTQRVSGYANPNSQIILFRDQNGDGTVDEGEWLTTSPLSSNSNGYFSTTLELGSGTHSVRAVILQPDGGYSASSDPLVITVDRQAPFGPDAPIPLEGADTGLSDADFVTNNQKPGFRLTLPTEDKGVHPSVAAREGMRLTLEGRTTVLASHILTASDLSDGYVDITPSMYLDEMTDRSWTGAWRLRGVLTDPAGNESTRQVGWSLPAWETDTTPPNAPDMNHSSYDSPLMDSSDSGRDSQDRITRHNQNLGFNFLQHTHAVSTQATLTHSDGRSWEIETASTTPGNRHTIYVVPGIPDGNGEHDPLDDGDYTIRFRSMDNAGNWSADSTPVHFTVDTSAPSTPAAPQLSTESDTGASNSDGITKRKDDLTISGQADADAIVRLYDFGDDSTATDTANATLIAEKQADSNGEYSFTDMALAPGVSFLRVSQDDLAGNESDLSGSLRVEVDVDPPTRPTVDFYSGTDRTPTISGTYDAANTDALYVRIGDRVYGETAGEVVRVDDNTDRTTVAGLVLDSSAGTWSIAIEEAYELKRDGGTNYDVIVRSDDLAGNVILSQGREQIRILPPADPDALAPTSISVAPQSDTGLYNDDGITREVAPFFRIGLNRGNGGVQAGDVVRLAEGNTDILRYTLQSSDLVDRGDGTYYVDLQPHASLASSGWNGTTHNDIHAQILRLQADGYQTSAETTLQRVVIDTNGTTHTNTTVTGVLQGDDTGNLKYPGTDSDGRLDRGNGFRLHGTASDNRELVSVDVFIDDKKVGTTAVAEDGDWVFDYNQSQAVLADGNHEVTAVGIDLAGNRTEVSNSFDILVDTVITPPSNLQLHPKYDSGVDGDNITNRAVYHTYYITGRAEPSVYVDGANQSTELIFFNDRDGNGQMDPGERLIIRENYTVKHTDGTFAVHIEPFQLTEGTHQIRVISVDAVGNRSAPSGPLAITVDRSPGEVLTVVPTPEAKDGLLDDINVVTSRQPTLRAILSEGVGVGDHIELQEKWYGWRTAGAGYVTATDISNGYIDIDVTDRQLWGTGRGNNLIELRAVRALITDVADNTDGSGRLDQTYYSRPEREPRSPSITLDDADDRGVSDSDGVTDKGKGWRVSGQAGRDSALVRIYAGSRLLGEVQPSDIAGSWSFTYEGPALVDGVHTIFARGVGVNGVEGTGSSPIFMRVDSKAYQRDYLWLDQADDAGPVSEDGITNETKLTIRGRATPGATVTLFDDRNDDGILDDGEALTVYQADRDNALTTLDADATTGLFAADIIVGVGEYRIRALETLNAGETGETGETSRLVGDARAPAEPLDITVNLDNPFLPNYAKVITAGGLELVDSEGRTVTNDAEPKLTLQLPEGVQVGDEMLLMNGNNVIIRESVTLRDLASAAIELQVTPAARLDDGVYDDLKVRLVDRAGNVSPDLALQSLVINTTGLPAPEDFGLLPSDDTGIASDDNLTNRTTGFTMTGSVSADAISVNIYANGKLLGEAIPTPTETGAEFSFLYSGSPLRSGVYSVEARA